MSDAVAASVPAEVVPAAAELAQGETAAEATAAAVSDTKVEQNGDAAAPAAQAEQQAETAKPEPVSDEEVKQRLLVLLGNSDLTETTEKMLRQQLEQELGQDLSSKKKLIRQEVLDYLEQHQPAEEEAEDEAEEEEEEEEEAPKAGKKRSGGGGFGGECVLSEALSQFLGVERMARTQVVKSIWDYVKANDLQNPKDKRKIIVDEKLATIFTPPITMFNMNKQLSKHCFSKASLGIVDEDEPAAKPRKRAKKARGGSDDEDEGGKSSRKGTGFARPLPLSEDLAAACGKPEMSRGELSKWIYTYVDQHSLKDPSDKRYANCDATLQRLTGERRIMLFGAQKYFKNHLLTNK